MTINVETIKPARTEILKETEHHSYKGRSEYLHKLIDSGLSDGTFKLGASESVIKKEYARTLIPAIKARYPWHASPAHLEKDILARFARLLKAQQKSEETEEKSDAKSDAKSKSKSKSKARSVKPATGKSKSKSSKKAAEKATDKSAELTVAA